MATNQQKDAQQQDEQVDLKSNAATKALGNLVGGKMDNIVTNPVLKQTLDTLQAQKEKFKKS